MFMFGTRNDAEPLLALDLECGFCQTIAAQFILRRVTRLVGVAVSRSHIVACGHCGLTTPVNDVQLRLYAELAGAGTLLPAGD